MALDTKKLQAISYLGWNFGIHILRHINPAAEKKPDQAELFRSYFMDDRITSFTPVERELLHHFDRCVNCGVCSDHCRVMSVSEGCFLGPEHIAISSSRSQPEFFADADNAFRCTVCGQCETLCPEGVPVSAMVCHMRSMIRRVSPQVFPEELNEFEASIKKSGLIYGENLVQRMPCAEKPEAVLFLGCRESREAERAQRLMDLLAKLGVSFTSIDEVCCGGGPTALGFDAHYGLPDKLLAEGPGTVITVCPHCHSVLRQEPALKGKMEVKNILEVIAERGKGKIKLMATGPVVFHDPCHLARGSGIVELPRKIMREAGADLKEMSESGLDAPCCGAGGGLRYIDPELARAVGRSRIADAAAAGAGTIVTECLGCKSMLSAVRGDSDPAVAMLTDLVCQAIK